MVLELEGGLVDEDAGAEVLLGGGLVFAGDLLEDLFDLGEVVVAGVLVAVDFVLKLRLTQMARTDPFVLRECRPSAVNCGARLRRGPSRIEDASAMLYPGRYADCMRTSCDRKGVGPGSGVWGNSGLQYNGDETGLTSAIGSEGAFWSARYWR